MLINFLNYIWLKAQKLFYKYVMFASKYKEIFKQFFLRIFSDLFVF